MRYVQLSEQINIVIYQWMERKAMINLSTESVLCDC